MGTIRIVGQYVLALCHNVSLLSYSDQCTAIWSYCSKSLYRLILVLQNQLGTIRDRRQAGGGGGVKGGTSACAWHPIHHVTGAAHASPCVFSILIGNPLASHPSLWKEAVLEQGSLSCSSFVLKPALAEEKRGSSDRRRSGRRGFQARLCHLS